MPPISTKRKTTSYLKPEKTMTRSVGKPGSGLDRLKNVVGLKQLMGS